MAKISIRIYIWTSYLRYYFHIKYIVTMLLFLVFIKGKYFAASDGP